MQSKAKTPDEYMAELPEDRKEPMKKLRAVINKNLPKGYKECMAYGMIGWVVPHSLYPPGYHCDPKLPLGLMSIASQKNFIAFYHMGLYADKKLHDWYIKQYAKEIPGKMDMGKACTRFKKPDQIPYKLIGELVAKLPAEEYISFYEKNLKNVRTSTKKV